MIVPDFSYLGPTVFWSHERKGKVPIFQSSQLKKKKSWKPLCYFKPLGDSHQTKQIAHQKHPKCIREFSLRTLAAVEVSKTWNPHDLGTRPLQGNVIAGLLRGPRHMPWEGPCVCTGLFNAMAPVLTWALPSHPDHCIPASQKVPSSLWSALTLFPDGLS